MVAIQTEDQLQTTVAKYLHNHLPPGVAWVAVNPLPGKESIGLSARRKRMGLRPGWPDIQLIWRGRPAGIELKLPGSYLSKVQKDMHEQITLAGGMVAVCRSLDEVIAFLGVLGVPVKAR